MPYAERDFACSGCGQLITRRAAPTAKPRCVPCNIKVSTDLMVSLHNRDGSAYEAWLLASIEALTRRLIAYRNRKSYEDIGQALRRE